MGNILDIPHKDNEFNLVLALDILEHVKNKIKQQGIFNHKYIDNLLNEHFTRRRDNRKIIWTLMVFQMWQEKWLA